MKAGTTSLAQALGIHPEINITVPKEIHFFNQPHITASAFQEYRRHFRTNKLLSGSAPQDYSKIHQPCNSKTAQELKKWVPNVKLIYIVRDPISRMQSHFIERHSIDMPGLESLSFRPNTTLWEHCKMTSSYGYQLEEYLKHFNENQIFVLRLENIFKNPTMELRKIFDFLEVQAIDVKFPNANSSDQKYFLRHAKIYPMLGHNRISKKIIQQNFKIGLKNKWMRNLLLQPAFKPEIEASVANDLQVYFRTDALKLSKTKYFDLISYYH